MSLWLTIVLAGLVTFAIRLSFIALLGRGGAAPSRAESPVDSAFTPDTPGGPKDGLPDWLRRALRFVPTAVLCAIIFPALLLDGGRLSLSMDNARLIAGLAAIAVAWLSRNVVLTIAAGMLVLVALQALGM